VFALPLMMLVFGGLALFVMPVQNTLSRRFERQCDRYALDRTQLRDAYRSAFRKLARLNKADPYPNPVTTFLFHSHPPIAQRLAMADEA
jgi:STE24 endopeptidase